MDMQFKVVHQGPNILQSAESPSNVSEVCHRRGTTYTQLHECKRRFQTHGVQGLKDLRPIRKWHPQATPPEI